MGPFRAAWRGSCHTRGNRRPERTTRHPNRGMSEARPHEPSSAPVDRRAPTRLNRARRFMNNYWLVPVVVIYLQLLAALLNVHGTGEDGLLARNRLFFQGIPLTIQILSHDFPYAVIGHAKEIAYYWGDRGADVPPEDVAAAVREQRDALYGAILASRVRHDTEEGGLVTVTADGRVVLHPVPSSNGALLTQIKGMPPREAMAVLRDPANRSVVEALAGSMAPVERIGRLVEDPDIAPPERARAFSAFLYSLEVTSESRYTIKPMVFKATLGHLEDWRLLGMYHFHNEVDLPPSDADVAASHDMRQFVFVLADDGFNLYDLQSGRATVSHHEADPDPLPPPGAPRQA